MYCSNKVCALCIVITVILSTAVSSQQFQQPQPYQYAFNDGRRRFNSGGLGGASSLTSSPAASSDFIKFPDDDQRNIPVTSLFHGKDDNNDYGRDNIDDETKSNLDLDDKQESSNEVSCTLWFMQSTNEQKKYFKCKLLINTFFLNVSSPNYGIQTCIIEILSFG